MDNNKPANKGSARTTLSKATTKKRSNPRKSQYNDPVRVTSHVQSRKWGKGVGQTMMMFCVLWCERRLAT